MATATETRISREAAALLDCCSTGLDKIVYEIAGQIARERSKTLPVRIEAVDVRQAADKVIAAIRSQVDSNALPKEADAAMEGMETCLKAKSKDLGLAE